MKKFLYVARRSLFFLFSFIASPLIAEWTVCPLTVPGNLWIDASHAKGLGNVALDSNGNMATICYTVQGNEVSAYVLKANGSWNSANAAKLSGSFPDSALCVSPLLSFDSRAITSPVLTNLTTLFYSADAKGNGSLITQKATLSPAGVFTLASGTEAPAPAFSTNLLYSIALEASPAANGLAACALANRSMVILNECPIPATGWTNYHETSVTDAKEVLIAVDINNHWVALVRKADALLVATSFNEELSQIKGITLDEMSTVSLALDGSNRAIALWSKEGIYFSEKSIKGLWSAPLLIEGSSKAISPEVKMDLSGNAVAIWIKEGELFNSFKSVEGSWSQGQPLTTERGITSAHLAMEPNGKMAVIWTREAAGTYYVESALSHSPKEPWKIQTIEKGDKPYSDAKIDINAKGVVAAVWTRENMLFGASTLFVKAPSIHMLTAKQRAVPQGYANELNWPSVPNATSYVVSNGKVTQTTKETAYEELNYSGPWPVIYTVKALGPNSETLFTSEVSLTKPKASSPINLTQSQKAILSGYANHFAWPVVEPAMHNGYKIYRGTKEIATVPTGSRSPSFEDLNYKGPWPVSYSVRTVSDFADESEESMSLVFNRPSAKTPLSLTAVQRVTPTAYANHLSWNAVKPSSSNGYMVFRNGEEIATIAPGATAPCFEDLNYKGPWPVSYSVKTISDYAETSAETAPVALERPISAAPTVLKATSHLVDNKQTVHLTWKAVSPTPVNGYIVYRGTAEIGRISEGTTAPSFDDANYSGPWPVTYNVKTLSAITGESPTMASVTVNKPATAAPVLSGCRMKSKSKVFNRLTWTAVEPHEATSYKLFREGSSKPLASFAPGSKLSYDDNKPPEIVSYYVVAMNDITGESAPSNIVNLDHNVW